ncbi:MAG: uracil-DNA glycosylase [Candidatus Rifleibacteriota bacterium]
MAAQSKKKTDEKEIGSVDLISTLTCPGIESCYEAEIAIPDEEDFIEVSSEPEVQKSSFSPSAPGKRLPQPQAKTAEKKSHKDDLESLTSLMGKNARPGKPARDKGQHAKQALTEIEPVENDSLERIAEEISKCEKCELCKTRNKTVPGHGPANARLVFIGEAPGADEDASGIPFVGRAGQHFDKILAAAGFDKSEIFICNILKCRPPGNRNPALSEMVSCTPFLQRQLKLIKPDLIACLGNVANRYVIGPDTPGITRIHGEWFQSIFAIPTMAMYHPSYLVRSASRAKGSPNWQMWQDIQKLKKRFDSV